MTQVTPPGWYPDPGQSADGPRTERWWDGNVWTDQVRAVGAAGFGGAPPTAPPAYAPGAPGTYPNYPAYPGQTASRRGLRTAIAIGIAVVVLAGIGGGVYFLTSDDEGGGGGESVAKSPSPAAPSEPGTPQEPRAPESSEPPGGPSAAPPTEEEGYATDMISGISLPVPDNWTGASGGGGASVTTDPYPCPRDTSKTCSRGGAYSGPAERFKVEAKTAEAAAKADIAVNAKESYGGKTYGKVTSHKELASKAVTVAGQKGYLVRWKAVTEKSDDGYVQSLAFPSPADKSTIVIVRFGIDVNEKSPKLTVMDEITRGIKAAPGGGGGSGQEV
ncbi:DUF2510 domain-containing protein [Streptomyces sp. NPDC050844]|uniref:DUF2510 domain-containing protein n=1 Tax=Streptomyces sp. NPDC050844 TaxID=3155790 RepID=UPI0033D843E4